jgi:hypothetical protein
MSTTSKKGPVRTEQKLRAVLVRRAPRGGLSLLAGIGLMTAIGSLAAPWWDLRTRASRRALEHNSYAAPSGVMLTIVTCSASALVILTVVAFM